MIPVFKRTKKLLTNRVDPALSMLRGLSKSTNSHPLLTRFVILLLLLFVAACWFAYSEIKNGLPTDHAVLTYSNSQSPAFVARNDHGVPHINATTNDGVFYAIGYAHAQDRLWQLEVQLRMVQGRLSEIFGKETVQQDIWFQTLDLYAAARSAWPALSKEAKASLTVYAAGVNAEIARKVVCQSSSRY